MCNDAIQILSSIYLAYCIFMGDLFCLTDVILIYWRHCSNIVITAFKRIAIAKRRDVTHIYDIISCIITQYAFNIKRSIRYRIK